MKCPVPESIQNGKQTFTSLTINSTVTYLCDNGYYLHDGTQKRTCHPNLKWTGKTPKCRSKKFTLNLFVQNEPVKC
jgi:hypothetical protein